jgi:hypothetical protein
MRDCEQQMLRFHDGVTHHACLVVCKQNQVVRLIGEPAE